MGGKEGREKVRKEGRKDAEEAGCQLNNCIIHNNKCLFLSCNVLIVRPTNHLGTTHQTIMFVFFHLATLSKEERKAKWKAESVKPRTADYVVPGSNPCKTYI